MSLICNKGCGRRSVKPHLYNHIYLKPNLSFVLFEAYREIVRKACIASFPVDRPALDLAAADSIETKNSTTQSFYLQILNLNQQLKVRHLQTFWLLISSGKLKTS